MKNLSIILTLLLLNNINILFAEPPTNYKTLKVPTVDAGGKVSDAGGKYLGIITTNGNILDADGKTVAHIDAYNNTIVQTTDEIVGKTDGEGNFFIVKNKRLTSWKTSYPEPGVQICVVRNLKGKIVATVHKTYKQYGTSALHFLLPKEVKKQGAKVKSKKKKNK